jgi:ornithine carbamoyltransferase
LVKDLLTLGELTKSEIFTILKKAMELKENQRKGKVDKFLQGRTIALFFDSPSLRTRLSFQIGMTQLGGESVYIKADPSEIYPSEDLYDQAMVLSTYVDGIIARFKDHQKVEKFAQYATVPVINGMSNDFHPTQVLADFLTILEEKRRLEKIKLAYFGDGGGNTAHSLLFGCAKIGIDLYISCPREFPPKEEYLKLAKDFSEKTGANIIVEHDPILAAKDADVIYTDSWEAEPLEIKLFWPYRVTRELVEVAASDVIILHCLPVIRDLEIASEVLNGSCSRIREQARNKLYVSKSILLFFIK